ncbi:hypothetical protein, partial [Salmonella enterica]|uniref:hypothetical protein n=1 Tax=Salmonella enterica TaxID=28901 RepID=UPI001E470E5F
MCSNGCLTTPDKPGVKGTKENKPLIKSEIFTLFKSNKYALSQEEYDRIKCNYFTFSKVFYDRLGAAPL